jgi:uncharacterized protein (TIGR03067 family)
MLCVIAVVLLAGRGAAQEKPKVAEELARLAGVWEVVSTTGHGQARVHADQVGHDGQPLGIPVFTIAGDVLTTENEWLVFPEPLLEFPSGSKVMFGRAGGTVTYRLRPAKAAGAGPSAIDLVVGEDVVLKGIYELKGDDLKLCIVNRLYCQDKDGRPLAQKAAGTKRPTTFTARDGGTTVLFLLKRVQK